MNFLVGLILGVVITGFYPELGELALTGISQCIEYLKELSND